jgi:hypothetical protein
MLLRTDKLEPIKGLLPHHTRAVKEKLIMATIVDLGKVPSSGIDAQLALRCQFDGPEKLRFVRIKVAVLPNDIQYVEGESAIGLWVRDFEIRRLSRHSFNCIRLLVGWSSLAAAYDTPQGNE